MKCERFLPRDRQLVWVAAPAMIRPPGTMVHHEPGGETEWGTASLCFYHHEWIVMRRDVAETFTRPCQVCAQRARRRAARRALGSNLGSESPDSASPTHESHNTAGIGTGS